MLLDVDSQWHGALRWARNAITTGGDTQSTRVSVIRTIFGASSGGFSRTNALDDASLRAMVQRAERMTTWYDQDPDSYPTPYPDIVPEAHAYATPSIWFDRTYALDARARTAAVAPLIALASSAGFSSAGYLEVSATGASVTNTGQPLRYYPLTNAQYSVTVRDATYGGSGWAGLDVADWGRIDAAALTRIAIEKCRSSGNAVAVEPGRYTVVLEPQAVCDLVAPLLDSAMDRILAEQGQGPFAAGGGNSKIGQRVIDPRITLSADPMDPDLGFVPFDWAGEPYLNTNWIENGVLKELAYPRFYGLQRLDKDWALPNSRAFRLSGGTATLDEMIADTARGVLVTRLNNVQIVDLNSMLLSGNTRDGLWLIERGKISKPIKNFNFTESPLFVLNSVEAMGIPKRVFRPTAPAVCPPLKARDFHFTGLMDAV